MSILGYCGLKGDKIFDKKYTFYIIKFFEDFFNPIFILAFSYLKGSISIRYKHYGKLWIHGEIILYVKGYLSYKIPISIFIFIRQVFSISSIEKNSISI